MKNQLRAAMIAALFAATAQFASAGPQYASIIDLGILDPGDVGSQGLSLSPGGVGTGRTLGVSNQGFSWTLGGGTVGLPNLASRPFASANGANDMGMVVGTGATTFFGSSPLPLVWNNGAVSQLPLPAGQSLGRANDINNMGMAVGSVDGGSAERAAIYANGSGSIITATTPGGGIMRTAFGINDAGMVAGSGTDPNNAARNVGILYDANANTAIEVDPLPGNNGTLAFGISEAGHVVGSSMMNQGSGMPFVWTSGNGSTAIPLPANTSSGSARGVNSAGTVVGNAGGQFAVPWLFDGTNTVAIQDLLPAGSGWDLSMNTSSSALGIAEDGTIIGTGIFNGETRGYALIPVPEPSSFALVAALLPLIIRRR